MFVKQESLKELDQLRRDCRQTAQKLAERAVTNPKLWETYYNDDGELCPPPAAIIGFLHQFPGLVAQRLGVKALKDR